MLRQVHVTKILQHTGFVKDFLVTIVYNPQKIVRISRMFGSDAKYTQTILQVKYFCLFQHLGRFIELSGKGTWYPPLMKIERRESSIKTGKLKS